jgi:soluble lytic murein transglycosylase-like protein
MSFDWETRRRGPIRRIFAALWRQTYRVALVAALVLTLFTLGATVFAQPEDLEQVRLGLMQRLKQLEHALTAREGELELAQLEINRLNRIHDYSRRHRIPADLAAAIYDIALAEGIEPSLAFSLVRVESGFTRRAVSSAGAVGLTQVMPATANWLQPGLAYNDLFERDTNLRLGFRYLKMLLQQYKGDLNLALLAYNRGPGRVDNILQAGGNPSNGYEGAVRAGAARPSND